MTFLAASRDLFERIATVADRHSPQTLFARALIIIVVPMLLLQALSAWWFYSQRGENVTNRLAQLLVRDLDLLITLRRDFPDDAHRTCHARLAEAAEEAGDLLQRALGGGEGDALRWLVGELLEALHAQHEVGEKIHMDLTSDTGHLPVREIVGRATLFFGYLIGFMAIMAVIGLIPTVGVFVVFL